MQSFFMWSNEDQTAPGCFESSFFQFATHLKISDMRIIKTTLTSESMPYSLHDQYIMASKRQPFKRKSELKIFVHFSLVFIASKF